MQTLTQLFWSRLQKSSGTEEDGNTTHIGKKNHYQKKEVLHLKGSHVHIDAKAFQGNHLIKELIVEQDAVLDNQCFENCTHLERVTIKGSATIGYYAFSGCTQLKEVSVRGGNFYSQ